MLCVYHFYPIEFPCLILSNINGAVDEPLRPVSPAEHGRLS